MGKLVILKFGEGSFEQGFPVTLQIGEESARPATEVQGKLPPAPEILRAYQRWQSTYRGLGLRSRLNADANQVTNASTIGGCQEAANRLRRQFNAWLQAESFRVIREKWLEKLLSSDTIRVILQVEDSQLQKLPWHLWDLMDRYPKAEIALGAPVYEQIEQLTPLDGKVRILAILGNSGGIDTQADLALLQQLPHAEIRLLVEPPRQDLSDRLWEGNWDILFFAGHSSSQNNGETGRIYINQTDSLTLSELHYGLKKAMERGLKLAIFNSCDGLGLARELVDLHIPQLIVMREPVPDQVAQAFLKYFLEAFSQGESLYLAVRQARERLQGLEDHFPCATWLPVLCQNPADVPPMWQDLCGVPVAPPVAVEPPLPTVKRRKPASALLSSVAIAALVTGARFLGWLQPLELSTFDHLLRLRPEERADPRLLVITIDDADIQAQRQQGDLRGISLSDAALDQLLTRLESHKPRAIGLDLYRDFSVDPKYPRLRARLKQSQTLVGICKVSDPEDPYGVEPPPEIASHNLGFSDFITDDDGVLRRHLLFMTPGATSRCQAPYAFASQLAFRYLAAEGIQPQFTADKNLQLGNTVFSRLHSRWGGYQGIDSRGAQMLLNYRSTETIAEQVSLTQILTGQFNPDAIKDRVVLIGVTAKTADDFWKTPLTATRGDARSSLERDHEMPGVLVHAHIVSQILNTVLDRRSLLWVWPSWGETIWVLNWSLVGGILSWWFSSHCVLIKQRWSRLAIALLVSAGVLYGVCFALLTQSGWVPLVPPLLALITTSGIVLLSTVFKPSS